MTQLHSNESPGTTETLGRHSVQDGGSTPAPAEPAGVIVGAGGDPLIVALPSFAVGSLALGMVLIGFLPATALGAVIPIVLCATGLFLLVVTVWAAALAQTIVAGITGTFSGFWLSLGALLLGLTHHWYGIDAAAATGTQVLFFISWACLFFFLLIPCLRLPVVYPLVVALVVVALALAAAGVRSGATVLMTAAGYVILIFSFLGFCAFVNVGLTAMGSKKPFPPLGKALISGA